MKETPNKKTAWLRYPLLIFFALCIWGLALVDMLLPARAHSDMENRDLALAPRASVRSVWNNTYTQRYEEYVNDQFVARDAWITLKSLCESALGKLENNGIVYGADGYLFEKLTDYDDTQLWKNVGYLADFAALYPAQSITVTVIPNSHAILTSKLPTGFPSADQLAAIDEIYAALADSGARVLDIAPALAAHADEYIFYRTDHHWTTLGAYYAYEAFAAAAGLDAVPLDTLPAHEVPDFYGTHYSKAKLWNAVPDTITWYSVPDLTITVDGAAMDGLYDLAMFEQRDKYAAFLHSNNALTVLQNTAREGDDPPSRALLIKDSYGNCYAPFLAGSFDEVYVVDLRYFSGVAELLAQTEFDEIYIMYNFSTLIQDLNIFKLTAGA